MKKIVFFLSHIMLVGLMVSVLLTSCSKDEYTITVIAGENGTAQVDIKKAVAGTTIKLSAEADEGYKLDKWNVTAGGAILADPTAATTSFTMPMADVTIQAEFSKVKIDILTAMHEDDNGYYCIVGMLPDGSDKRYLFRGDGTIYPKQATIGSDGKTLIMGCNSNTGVRAYDLSTHTLSVLTGVGDYEVPVFSPDMKKVFVYYDTDDEFISIDVATKAVTVLDSENDFNYPSFIDAQTMIVTHGWNWGNSIVSIKTDGTNMVMLKEEADGVYYKHPLFSSALNKVIYIKSDTKNRVCLMNPDGTGEVVLTPEDVNYASPSVSTDGKYVAFAEGNNKIFVAPLNGTSIGSKVAISDENSWVLWRPMFCEIDKDLFESLTKYVAPTVGPK